MKTKILSLSVGTLAIVGAALMVSNYSSASEMNIEKSINDNIKSELRSAMEAKGCHVFGKIKFVDYGEDYKVKFVDYGEDLKIKYVDYGEGSKGKWKSVDYGEDYKIKIVDYGEDFKVKEVDYGEGC